MHRNRSVTEHCLRPGCGHRHMTRFTRLWIDDRISNMPEMTLYCLVEDLVVTHGGLQVGIPVHQPFAAEDQALAKKVEERLPHGPGTDVVEREARAGPVAATAH